MMGIKQSATFTLSQPVPAFTPPTTMSDHYKSDDTLTSVSKTAFTQEEITYIQERKPLLKAMGNQVVLLLRKIIETDSPQTELSARKYKVHPRQLYDFVIAGGAVSGIIGGPGHSWNDIDVYFKSEELRNFYSELIANIRTKRNIIKGFIIDESGNSAYNLWKKASQGSVNDFVFVTDKAITFRRHDTKPIQLIMCISGNPEVVTSTFDFVHCSAYFDVDLDKIVLSKSIYNSIVQKVLRLNDGRKTTQARVKKYLERGFILGQKIEFIDEVKVEYTGNGSAGATSVVSASPSPNQYGVAVTNGKITTTEPQVGDVNTWYSPVDQKHFRSLIVGNTDGTLNKIIQSKDINTHSEWKTVSTNEHDPDKVNFQFDTKTGVWVLTKGN